MCQLSSGRKRAARDHRSVYYCRAAGEVKNHVERRQRAPGRSAIIVSRPDNPLR